MRSCMGVHLFHSSLSYVKSLISPYFGLLRAFYARGQPTKIISEENP
jgi:hypothetical protein